MFVPSLLFSCLKEKPVFRTAGIVLVICGLDAAATQAHPLDYEVVKKYTVMDEISPFATVVSATYAGTHLGTTMLM